jgi:hypothetical protein
MVLDVLKPLGHKKLLEHELEGFGIRLNKQPPPIHFKRKDKGGVNLTSLVSGGVGIFKELVSLECFIFFGFFYGPGGVLMDSVHYSDESPWPELADGRGSSLELIEHTLDNSLAESWRASATAGTPGDYNDENIVGVEDELTLDEIFPNPVRDAATVSYSLKNSGRVIIKLTSLMGYRVATLLDEDQQAGHHEIEYHFNQPDGIYVIILESADGLQIHKILIAQ